MNRSAMFSEDRVYRYALWRVWAAERGYVLFIGLNPSTADETKDDPTVRRCIGFAKQWGYGGLCMANLFAYRATKPADMRRANQPEGSENNETLKNLANTAGIVVAAWGTNGPFRGRDKRIRAMITGMYCLGVTKEGHPKHPLYVPYDTKLKIFPQNRGG